MAGIADHLKKILSSVYGKDVRQAIHDAIHQCYEDGKAGAVDLIARERINNLVANDEASEGNSELIDIRVGVDGTRYGSAGDAVRYQVNGLKDDMPKYFNINSANIESIASKTNLINFDDFTPGHIVTTSGLDENELFLAFGYVKIKPGTNYSIHNFQHFIFYDERLNVISNHNNDNGLKTSPENAAFFRGDTRTNMRHRVYIIESDIDITDASDMAYATLNERVKVLHSENTESAKNADLARNLVEGIILVDYVLYDDHPEETGLTTNFDDMNKVLSVNYVRSSGKTTMFAIKHTLGKRSDIENKKLLLQYNCHITGGTQLTVGINKGSGQNWGNTSKFRNIGAIRNGDSNKLLEITLSTDILDRENNGGAFEQDDDVGLIIQFMSTSITECYIDLKAFVKHDSKLPAYANASNLGSLTEQDVLEAIKSNWVSKAWLVYGDSITAISNGNGLQLGWARYVNDKLGFSNFYGRGVGGQSFRYNTGTFFANPDGTYNSRPPAEQPEGTTVHNGSFCSWDRISAMIPDTIKDTIDLVFIMGGTNDLPAGENVITYSEPIWSPENQKDSVWISSADSNGGDYDLNNFCGAIASTIMKIQTRCPNALIVLGTPLQRWDGYSQYKTGNVNNTDLSDVMKKVADYMGIPCIDVTGTCGINGYNYDTYITDGVHPYSDKGQAMLARTIISGLKQIEPIMTVE